MRGKKRARLDASDLALRCLQAFVSLHLQIDETLLCPVISKTHGKFMSLPFKQWLQLDSKMFEAAFATICQGVPSEGAMVCIGAWYMPDALKARLIGQATSICALPFQRYNISEKNEYALVSLQPEQLQDVEVAKSAFKGMIACSLQRFVYQFLCKPCELIAAFNHPAAQKDLPEERQLAIGVMREVMIIPRFGSMQRFWQKHAEMIEEGGKLIGFYWIRPYTAEVIFSLLTDDLEATAMFQMCLDLGMSKTHFNRSMKHLCCQFD